MVFSAPKSVTHSLATDRLIIPGRVVAWAAIMVFSLVAWVENAGGGEPGAPLRIGHYSTANGMAGFVLDRLGTPVKMRFDGSDEVLALAVVPERHNEISLKRDDGGVVLHIDDRGGVMLFGRNFGDGVSAVRDQAANPLTITPATKAQAEGKAAGLAQQLKRTGGATVQIVLDAPRLDAASTAWAAMADAIVPLGVALADIIADPIGHDTVRAKVRRVIIRDAGAIGIRLDGQTLIIEIAADKPIVGRPSSARLKSTISDLL
jgi:hypothetical protein